MVFRICQFYFFIFSFATAPILGNFTEEEANGSLVPQDTLEFPLQRDEVQTLNTKGDRNNHTPQSESINSVVSPCLAGPFQLIALVLINSVYDFFFIFNIIKLYRRSRWIRSRKRTLLAS